MIDETKGNSSVLTYYSGHGVVDEETGQYFLVPNDYDSAKQKETWIKAEEINERLNKLKTKQLILLLDCCHTAGINRPNKSLTLIKPLYIIKSILWIIYYISKTGRWLEKSIKPKCPWLLPIPLLPTPPKGRNGDI